jgi:hypothetical protein
MFDKVASTIDKHRDTAGARAAKQQGIMADATTGAVNSAAGAIGGLFGAGGGAPAPGAPPAPVAGPGGPVGMTGPGGIPAPGIMPPDYSGASGNIGATGDRGNILRDTTPGYLQGSQAGNMQQALLESLFGKEGVSRQFLNQDLANIRSSTQQAQQDFAGNQRFRGSGVGAAIGQAVGAGGVATESRRMAQAEQEELQRSLALSGAVTRDLTNPLMSAVGIGTGSYDTMMARAAADAAQPSGFETGMSMATGLLDAYMPG